MGEQGADYGVVEPSLNGLTVCNINVVNLIIIHDGIRANKDDAGRQKIIGGTGYYSRAIFHSGARIGSIMDYLMVLLVHTAFLWKGAFQNENS